MGFKTKLLVFWGNGLPAMPKNGFTLLELIIVIVIIGILATLGLTNYTNQLEYSRSAEAVTNIGFMRKLSYEYYLKNATLENIQSSDVGVDNTCSASRYFRFYTTGGYPEYANLVAVRCTSAGKSPNASREYYYYMSFYPGTWRSKCYCYYSNDNSPCFGLKAGADFPP